MSLTELPLLIFKEEDEDCYHIESMSDSIHFVRYEGIWLFLGVFPSPYDDLIAQRPRAPFELSSADCLGILEAVDGKLKEFRPSAIEDREALMFVKANLLESFYL